MEDKIVKDLRDIDFDKIEPKGFVDNNRAISALNQLRELKIMIDEMLDIKDNVELPNQLISIISSFSGAVVSFVNQIEQIETGGADVIVRKKEQYLINISNYYTHCFNIDNRNNNNENNKLLLYYSIVKSFAQNNEELNDEIENIKNSLSDKISESQQVIDNLKINSDESESILNELKKKTSNQTVSDYAIVFKNEASKYNTLSEKWIKAGIILSITFVILIIAVSFFKILPTEVLKENGELLRYNFSNLFTKIIIIAVLIFLMSFSFKQYNINKHLQTLNTHRQNALNSYQLFTKSIVGDDANSRNALMIQVAKAIYEHTQSTGFLNEKSQNVNSGIVELTKIIGKNNTI